MSLFVFVVFSLGLGSALGEKGAQKSAWKKKMASEADRERPLFPEGGTLGISGWGYAAGTLEPLTYTRASSAEFCYPILE